MFNTQFHAISHLEKVSKKITARSHRQRETEGDRESEIERERV